MNPSLPPSNQPVTASEIRKAVNKLKQLEQVTYEYAGYATLSITGMIGQLSGVRFIESELRGEFIDKFEKDVQDEIKKRNL